MILLRNNLIDRLMGASLRSGFHRARTALSLSILLLFGTTSFAEVVLYDTHGAQDPAAWTLVQGTAHRFASPEHIFFENDVFRVTYPILNEEQQAGHSYFVKVRDEWMRVTGANYGDYTYFIDSIQAPPTSIEILRNTPQEVALSFHYQHKNYRAESDLKWAYQGDISLTKTLALHENWPGVFVKLQSLPVNPHGEREVGFGGESPLVFAERVVSQHPLARHHVDLEMDKSHRYYAVSLPLSDSFYRILVLSRPMLTFSYQFRPDSGGGKITVNRLVEDSRDAYQVFLGAAPFDSSDSLVEFESIGGPENSVQQCERASNGQFLRFNKSCSLPIAIPASGSYRLVLRYRSVHEQTRLLVYTDQKLTGSYTIPKTKGFEFFSLHDGYYLSSGDHAIELVLEDGEIDADNLLLLPLWAEGNFPLDIARNVTTEMIHVQHHFEAESMPSQVGKTIPDQTASNGTARLASVQNDAPGFLVFGPYQPLIASGKYVARFTMKIADNTSSEPVAILDVNSSRAGVLSRRILTGKDFMLSDRYQTVELDFMIPFVQPYDVHSLEFRVYFTGRMDISVDVVEFLPKEHS